MDKRKKVSRIFFILLMFLLVILFFYNAIKTIRVGKQEILLTMNSKYYSNSDLDALVEVKKYNKINESVKAKIKAELLDENEKKVNDVEPFLGTVQKNEKLNLEINLPENIEKGIYYLKITSKSGISKDVIKVPVNIEGNNKDSNTIISLDKGIYKPGDEVNYRILMLSKKDNIPEKNEIQVSIYDGNDNKVYTEKTKTSEFGIVSGSFGLADEVNSGTYKLIVNYGSREFVKSFNVNPYITPKFEVAVTSDKDTYITGEKANITVNAKYFFGEPVQNAEVILKIGEEEIKGITNAEGNFTTEYEITENKEYNFNVEVTDSSNYLIESSKKIYGATDKFEIELLPEFGSIVRGIDNNIYVITKKASGEPLKTVNKINVGNIKRDVITDESGMKYFTLTSSDISTLKTDYTYNNSSYSNSSYNNYLDFEINSTDVEGNSIAKTIPLEISNSKVLLITDKNKYNEKDDISIKIEGGNIYANKELFICKGEKLIKTVNIKDDSTEINLGEYSGLIDIYLKPKTPNSNTEYAKKTIFVKPDKNLAIDIKTDSEEYSPKDKLNIEFTTENEEGSTVDSALLVSILDEAVLSLADNDLSIDNLKLALEDIELSDGITAADLYAEILDNKLSYNLDTILLKQNNSNISIISKSYNNYLSYTRSRTYENAFGIIFIIIAFIFFLKKSKKNRNIIADLILGLAIFLTLSIILTIASFDIIEYLDIEDYTLFIFVGWLVASVVLYIVKLYEYKKYISKLILILVVLPIIWSLIFGFIYEVTYYEESIIYIFIFFAFIFWLILTIASMDKPLSKGAELIRKFIGYSLKSLLFWIVTIFLITKTCYFGILITLTIYIMLDVYIFRQGKTENIKKIIQDGKIYITYETIIAILDIITLFIIFGFLSLIKTPADDINYEFEDDIPYNAGSLSGSSSFGGGMSLDAAIQGNSFYDNATDSSGAASIRGGSVLSGIGESLSDLFESNNTINDNLAVKQTDEDIVYEESDIQNNELNENNSDIEIKKEENVRNVFLESLAFIPEVVTENGKANVGIDISDNITTWNIQVVGNTKDGRIGSSSKTFKVFKEFFVDFSLPTNSVIGDYVEIPVTIYNYTENDLSVELNVVENDWCKIGNYEKNVSVLAKGTNMVYVPLEILKNGNNKLRVESKANGVSDIVEKSLNVNFNGLEKTSVEASGSIKKDFTQDIIFNEKAIDGSKNLKVKLFPSPASEIINGMESMLKLPSGCFEQTSSSLYPDILVLKYLKENNLDNEEIKEKALDYISKGYQKLLTCEVPGEKGGYSLYGNKPAEPVITAYGLMEFKELSEVYEVDENVINNMKEYLYRKQKVDGDFAYSSTYIGGTVRTDKYAMNAYIIWALSEADPEDSRLNKSVKYLENNLDKINDNYTLALIANVFANTSNKNADNVIKTLSENIKVEENYSYITSDIRDYYGTYGKYQNIQTTALTSIALSKLNKDSKANGELINYIISSRRAYGNWGTTQSTILALKAINSFNTKGKFKDQTITVNVNGKEQSVEIKENALDIYEFNFDNVQDENTVQIKMKDGTISYEIIKEYYEEYGNITNDNKIEISQTLNTSLNVNDIIKQNISISNNSGENIENGMVKVSIPQGASCIEDSLLQMKYEGKIEKYEYNYGSVNIYLRNFVVGELVNLEIDYRAMYPEKITGGAIRVYDYYNPDIEGIAVPVEITVNK